MLFARPDDESNLPPLEPDPAADVSGVGPGNRLEAVRGFDRFAGAPGSEQAEPTSCGDVHRQAVQRVPPACNSSSRNTRENSGSPARTGSRFAPQPGRNLSGAGEVC